MAFHARHLHLFYSIYPLLREIDYSKSTPIFSPITWCFPPSGIFAPDLPQRKGSCSCPKSAAHKANVFICLQDKGKVFPGIASGGFGCALLASKLRQSHWRGQPSTASLPGNKGLSSGESGCTLRRSPFKKRVKKLLSWPAGEAPTRNSVAKRVPKTNRVGKRSLCENLTSNSSQMGRNSECSKLWSEGTFCTQVRTQHWQICCFDDISPEGCKQTAAVRGGQLQRRFCFLLVLPTVEAHGEAGGSAWSALASSMLLGLFITAAPWTIRSLWDGRGPVGRKGIGKGLCGMLLPLLCSLETPRRQRGYTPVSVFSPHQV